MDLSNSLDAVLSRRAAEASERAAAARAERHREDADRAAVEYGEAVSQKEEDRAASPVDPTAAFDKIRQQDTQHLIDIIA